MSSHTKLTCIPIILKTSVAKRHGRTYTSQYLPLLHVRVHSEILLFMIVYQTKHFVWDVPQVHI